MSFTHSKTLALLKVVTAADEHSILFDQSTVETTIRHKDLVNLHLSPPLRKSASILRLSLRGAKSLPTVECPFSYGRSTLNTLKALPEFL